MTRPCRLTSRFSALLLASSSSFWNLACGEGSSGALTPPPTVLPPTFAKPFGSATSSFQVDTCVRVWTVTRKPELFVFPDDTGCSELCANRKRNNPVTPASVDPLGVWSWGNPRFSRGRC